MKWNHFKIKVIGLCLFVLSGNGCSKDPTIISISVTDPQIEINGILVPGYPLGVSVNKVSSEIFGEVDYSLPDAEVILFEDNIPIIYLQLDTTRRGSLSVLRSSSFFISETPTLILPNRVYHLEASAPGLPTAVSAKIRYTPVFAIDTILNYRDIRPINAEFYATEVDFQLNGLILENSEGILDMSTKILADTAQITIQTDPTEFLTFRSGFSTIDVNPREGMLPPTISYQVPGGIPDRIEEQDRFVLFNFAFFPEEYNITIREILDRQGSLEGLNTLEADLSPISYNAESGFGSFYIIDLQTIIYEL